MRIALGCRQGLFGEALAALLEQHGSFQVVATEASVRGLVTAAKDNHAHVLIVDSEDMEMSDLQFLLGARAFADFAVMLIVSEETKAEFADVAVDRLIPRTTDASKLFDNLMELGGKIQLTRPFVREGRRAYGNGNELTRREYEVAQLVARGMPNRRISEVTALREQSVKNLVSVIMRKLNCENRVQVALKLTKGGVTEESIRD